MNQSTFTQYAARMRLAAERSALYAGCTAEDARDVASDVLVAMWTMHHRLIPAKCVGYAAVAAHNKALNLLRDRKMQIVSVEDSSTDICLVPSAEELMISRQEAEWLLAELGRLPSTQQTILSLRQNEELETTEIAERLGITPGSVATLLSRARRALFNAIKERRNK